MISIFRVPRIWCWCYPRIILAGKELQGHQIQPVTSPEWHLQGWGPCPRSSDQITLMFIYYNSFQQIIEWQNYLLTALSPKPRKSWHCWDDFRGRFPWKSITSNFPPCTQQALNPPNLERGWHCNRSAWTLLYSTGSKNTPWRVPWHINSCTNHSFPQRDLICISWWARVQLQGNGRCPLLWEGCTYRNCKKAHQIHP